jgi:hypothetical protein
MDMVMAGAIEKSAAVIVCASPDYITGVNAQKEWMYVRQPATSSCSRAFSRCHAHSFTPTFHAHHDDYATQRKEHVHLAIFF